jgi:SAM-dependent methyltransferase
MSEYSPEQHDLNYPDGVERHWWQRARNHVILQQLRRHTDGGEKILEVGCGRGLAVKYLSAAGIDIVGVEPSQTTAIAGAAERITFGITAEEMPIETRRGISVILLLDVIEHLPDPADFLRRLQASFPELETVLLTVPARRELWSNYDEFFGHYRRYDRKMIRQLAHDVSWRHVSSSYFLHAPYLPMLALSVLGLNRSVNMAVPVGMQGSMHDAVGLGFIAEYHLLPGWLVGSSIISCLAVASG